MNASYVVTIFVKGESGSGLPSKPSPAFKAADDKEAVVLAEAWIRENKPQLYEGVEAKLRRGDELIKQWPIIDANFH
jgi:hypothetical protein